jgi:hypothetical protein
MCPVRTRKYVTTKEIPKRELRVKDWRHPPTSDPSVPGVTTKEIPKRELRAELLLEQGRR